LNEQPYPAFYSYIFNSNKLSISFYLLHLCSNILLIKVNRIIPIFGPIGMLDR